MPLNPIGLYHQLTLHRDQIPTCFQRGFIGHARDAGDDRDGDEVIRAAVRIHGQRAVHDIIGDLDEVRDIVDLRVVAGAATQQIVTRVAIECIGPDPPCWSSAPLSASSIVAREPDQDVVIRVPGHHIVANEILGHPLIGNSEIPRNTIYIPRKPLIISSLPSVVIVQEFFYERPPYPRQP